MNREGNIFCKAECQPGKNHQQHILTLLDRSLFWEWAISPVSNYLFPLLITKGKNRILKYRNLDNITFTK